MSPTLAVLDLNEKRKGVFLLELLVSTAAALIIIIFSAGLLKISLSSLLKDKKLTSASYLAQAIMEETLNKPWEEIKNYDSQIDDGAFWEEDLEASVLRNYRAIISAAEIETNLKEIKLDLSWDNEKENIELITLKTKN